MKRISKLMIFAVLFAGLVLMAFGMDSAQRLAIIKALKKEGIVGENNKGYLEFKGEVKAKEVVDEENNVRRRAYEEIAKQTNVSVEQVGVQRAAQIASESPAGTMIQLPDGRWVKK